MSSLFDGEQEQQELSVAGSRQLALEVPSCFERHNGRRTSGHLAYRPLRGKVPS